MNVTLNATLKAATTRCLAVTATALIVIATGPSAGAEPVVETTAGELEGYTAGGVHTFKGVRYGQSTAGAARFKPPRPVAAWEGVQDATRFGPICPQRGDVAVPTRPGPDGEAQRLEKSEDCLVLNVWTPGLEGERAVMVWLHGRGFAQGAGSEPLYDGAALARRGDAVVITINHRLNVFGYLHLTDVGGDEFAGSGLAGMLDAELALAWVRDNVSAFGGDPDNVTIFGESGGGLKVSTLLAMPSAEDLFHRGIIQSGPGIRGVPADAGRRAAKTLMARLGVEDARALQQVPMDDLLAATAAGGDDAEDAVRYAPVVDGELLPVHPYHPAASPTAAGKPIMIGANRDEALLFLIRDPSRGNMTETQLRERVTSMLGDDAEKILSVYRETRPDASPWDQFVAIASARFYVGSHLLAERHAATGTPVYMYSFEHEVSDTLKAAHGMEIAYAFSTASSRDGADENTEAVETDVSEAWIAFARSGNPNHDTLPRWPTYSADGRAVMVFDTPSRVVTDLRGAEREAWAGIDLRR